LKAQTLPEVGESEQEEDIEEANEEGFQEEDIEVINGIKFKLKNKKSQKFETEENTITTTVAEINFEEEEDKPLNSRKRNFVQMKTPTPVADKPKKKADVNGKAWKKARSQRKSNQNQKKFKKYKKPNSDKKKTGNDKKRRLVTTKGRSRRNRNINYESPIIQAILPEWRNMFGIQSSVQ